MTTEQDAAPDAASTDQTDDAAEQGAPAQTVRVPNVSPGAKSGLDHTVIGSNALTPPEDDDEAETTDTDDLAAQVPQDDQDAALAWVREAPDSDEATKRADAVWNAYQPTGGGDTDGEAGALLAGALRDAVHGGPAGDATGGDPAAEEAAHRAQVHGQVMDSPAAGTGDAENAETGEVTKGGSHLPDATGQGDDSTA